RLSQVEVEEDDADSHSAQCQGQVRSNLRLALFVVDAGDQDRADAMLVPRDLEIAGRKRELPGWIGFQQPRRLLCFAAVPAENRYLSEQSHSESLGQLLRRPDPHIERLP